MDNYQYDITSTVNNKVNEYALQQTIENKDSGITIQLLAVSAQGNVLSILFKDELPEDQELLLDSIVYSHLGEDIEYPEPEEVKILEEDPNNKTGGHFLAKGLEHEVPEGVSGEITSSDFSFPYDVALLDFEYIPELSMQGDRIGIIIAPDTVVGAISANVSAGESTIPVTSTVIENIEVGYLVSLTDGVEVDDLGVVISKDEANSTITVSKPLVGSYLVTTPTYVRMGVQIVESIRLNGTNASVAVGSAKIGGSYLPANTVIRILYENVTGTAKTFSGVVEVLF